MSEIRVTESHNLGADEARKRIDFFEDMVSKFGVKMKWSGHSASLKGMSVSGSVDVAETQATVVVKLGMLAKRVVDSARMEKSIRRRLREAFDAD